MARLARVIAEGYPHHITQRGNRRLPTFFCDADYEAYLALLAEHCAACGRQGDRRNARDAKAQAAHGEIPPLRSG